MAGGSGRRSAVLRPVHRQPVHGYALPCPPRGLPRRAFIPSACTDIAAGSLSHRYARRQSPTHSSPPARAAPIKKSTRRHASPALTKSPTKKAQGHSLAGMALGLIDFGSAPYAAERSVTSGSWPDGRRPARWDRPPGTARCSRARRCRSQGPRGVPRCRLRCTA